MLDLCVVFVDFIRPSPVLSSAPSSPAAALPLLIFNFALALLPLLLLLVLLLFASTVCLNYTITITITLSSLCCLLCKLNFRWVLYLFISFISLIYLLAIFGTSFHYFTPSVFFTLFASYVFYSLSAFLLLCVFCWCGNRFNCFLFFSLVRSLIVFALFVSLSLSLSLAPALAVSLARSICN